MIEKLTEDDGTVEVFQIQQSFSLANLLQLGEDPDAVASFLYYMGLLTRTRDVPPRLRIPNLVARKLFLDLSRGDAARLRDSGGGAGALVGE